MTATCTICKQAKPRTEFHRAPRNINGLHSYCKPCSTTQRRQRYAVDPEKRQDELRLTRYGMTATEFREMMLEQDGLCAVCREVPDKQLYVDHCHETGRVRGLLCHLCNSGMGQLDDSPLRLRQAAAYLEAST